MNELDLAWDTFDFYIMEISEYEARYYYNTQTISNVLESNNKDQRKRLLERLNKCMDALLVLYKKQIDSISDLIKLNESGIEIPPEKEIDTSSLIALKNITSTLIEEMRIHKNEIKDLLG